MDNKKQIVDSYGHPISVDDTNKVKQLKKFIYDNIWNIFGVGISLFIPLGSIINIIVSTIYSRKCSEYYGIDQKYFNSSPLFQNKILFFVAAIILLVYPVLFQYISSKSSNKICIVLSFFATVFLLFIQNLIYMAIIIDSFGGKWLPDDNVAIIVFLILDIVLAYFIIFRDHLKKKPLSKFEIKIISFVLMIFLSNVVFGVTSYLDSQISDKRFYEVIDNSKVVITEYNGKFLIMDCDIQNDVLCIEKGKYSFMEMLDTDIEYKKYKDVQCK